MRQRCVVGHYEGAPGLRIVYLSFGFRAIFVLVRTWQCADFRAEKMNMDALIVGGGIGGLVTALYLHSQGISVRVFEAVPEIRELGVGINLLPHAMRGISELGLRETVEQAGVLTDEQVYYNKFGQLIWAEPRGLTAGYKWPQVSINRGRLQGILFDAVVSRIGKERVFTDHRFTGFEETGGKVVAQFSGYDGGARGHQEGDILIAADGIHSRAREIFYPDEGDPKYAGLMLWRAVSRSEPFLTGATMVVAGHDEQRFIGYPLSTVGDDGLCLVNWVVDLHRPNLLEREDWNRRGRHEDFIAEFDDWNFDWLDIPALFRRAEAVFEFPMVDRDPVSQWSFGRVTLLGDAAHPMYPIGSNGASQAILDAGCLARALDEHADPVEALKAYESERLPATAKIVESNRGTGPQVVMQMAEERAPDGFDNIEDVIPREELEAIAAKYKALAGFGKDQVNK